MPSLSENLASVKDSLLQRVLDKLFSGFVAAAPSAVAASDVTAAIPAAAPAGGAGATAGAWDTAANRDAAIATINGLQEYATEQKADFNALRLDVLALRETVANLTNLTA